MIRQIRPFLFAAYFYMVTLAFGLGGVVARRLPGDLPLRFAQAWVGCLMAGLPLAGVRVRITGLEHLPRSGPALLASQHQSEFDTLIWMRRLQRPAYVMKQELTRTPLVGPMLVPAGMIPVDRSAGAAALRKLLADVSAAQADGRQIVIFPEGTRVAPGRRVALQPGVAAVAARLGLPVIPVATNSGMSWGPDGRRPRAGVIEIAIGSPLPRGLPRDAMLAQIESFWRSAEARRFAPGVDNSVEELSANGVSAPVDSG